MEYTFDKGTVQDLYASLDDMNRFYFPEDPTNNVYELIVKNHEVQRIDVYPGALSKTASLTKLYELTPQEFENIVREHTLYNVHQWRVRWTNGVNWWN